jgi:endonuclease YncB( thermonuclease family)
LIKPYKKATWQKSRVLLSLAVTTVTIMTIFAMPNTAVSAERVVLPSAIRKCETAKRITCVVDGDTLWLNGDKIRVADIDTPEITEPKCASELMRGNKATDRFITLINQGPLSFTRGREGIRTDTGASFASLSETAAASAIFSSRRVWHEPGPAGASHGAVDD